MSAKNAELDKTGSHYVDDSHHSQTAEGIGKEQVHGYFTATWRGQPVMVTVAADRYAASFHSDSHSGGTNRLTDWRAYASEARFIDPEKNGNRGADVSGTARAALGKLCVPLMMEWLKSDAYTVSFQAAAANMIMRKFRDHYSVERGVSEALATFRDRLPAKTVRAIDKTLAAYKAYASAQAHAAEVIANSATRS